VAFCHCAKDSFQPLSAELYSFHALSNSGFFVDVLLVFFGLELPFFTVFDLGLAFFTTFFLILDFFLFRFNLIEVKSFNSFEIKNISIYVKILML